MEARTGRRGKQAHRTRHTPPKKAKAKAKPGPADKEKQDETGGGEAREAIAPATATKDPLPAALTQDPRSKDRVLAPETPRYLPEDHASARVQIRKLAYNLATAFKALPGEGRFQTVAVLPFVDQGEASKKEQVGALVTSELATDLKRDHGLWLVERAAIEEALHESYLAETGITDPKGAARLGELLSAQALVVGEVSFADGVFLVNARILSTEKGTVFSAAQVSLPAEQLISFARDAVVLRTRAGAVFRSVLIPGWGQIYNLQPAKGYGLLATELGVGGAALGFHLVGLRTHARYKESGDVRLLGDEKSFYQARNVLLAVAAGVWVYNLLDAWLSGVQIPVSGGGM